MPTFVPILVIRVGPIQNQQKNLHNLSRAHKSYGYFYTNWAPSLQKLFYKSWRSFYQFMPNFPSCTLGTSRIWVCHGPNSLHMGRMGVLVWFTDSTLNQFKTHCLNSKAIKEDFIPNTEISNNI